MVKEIHNLQTKGELQQGIAHSRDGDESNEEKTQHYNVEQLGEVPKEREDRTMRIIVCQMGGCTSPETTKIKIAATERLTQKYDINLCLFIE